MTDAVPTNVSSPARFECTMQIDSKFSSRITAATFRYVLMTPLRIVWIVTTLLFFAVVLTVATGPNEQEAVGWGVAFFLIVAALYFLLFLLTYFRARKRVDKRFPVGSEFSISMGDGSLRLTDPLVAVELSYKLYKSVRATKEVVGLNLKLGRSRTLIPRELFTQESLAWLTETVRGT